MYSFTDFYRITLTFRFGSIFAIRFEQLAFMKYVPVEKPHFMYER